MNAVSRSTTRVVLRFLARYALAAALFGAVLGLSLLLDRVQFKLNLTIPIVFALVAAAWWGGRGPGILISILFQATTILYVVRPPDLSIGRAWFGYLSVFSLYIFLVLLITHLKDTRDRVRAQRDLLSVTLSSIGDAVIATDTGGHVTFMNGAAERMTGWQQADARDRDLGEVFNIVSEKSGESVDSPVGRVLSTGTTVGLANHTVLISKAGKRVPIDDCASPIKKGDSIEGVVLVFSDVTERKRAERSRRDTEIMSRLVEAQESERRRIARDLHDHLGQKMTALRLKITALLDRCSEDRHLCEEIKRVDAAAGLIDRDIEFLSWELRPTELEELGLENALGTYVREWSHQYGIKAEFHATSSMGKQTAERMGRLPQAVETNLYRIVQEALNNILKHAHATAIDVLIQHDRNDLLLIIEDNGRGFEASSNGDRRGLGLVGMRERAALLSGTLEIDSSENGTTVIVRIPLAVSVPAAQAAAN